MSRDRFRPNAPRALTADGFGAPRGRQKSLREQTDKPPVSPPWVDKDARVWIEIPGSGEPVPALVRERQGSRVLIEGPEARISTDTPVRLRFESRGVLWSQDAVCNGVSIADGASRSELELRGVPEPCEQRGALRVGVCSGSLRGSLGGEECEVIELSQVAFAVRARGSWSPGDVLEAVLYDRGEALPGRVRVESARALDAGYTRFGLSCLDGRLKSGLAGVCLVEQRAHIERDRRRTPAG